MVGPACGFDAGLVQTSRVQEEAEEVVEMIEPQPVGYVTVVVQESASSHQAEVVDLHSAGGGMLILEMEEVEVTVGDDVVESPQPVEEAAAVGDGLEEESQSAEARARKGTRARRVRLESMVAKMSVVFK